MRQAGAVTFLSATQLGRLFAAHPLCAWPSSTPAGGQGREQSFFSTGAVLARTVFRRSSPCNTPSPTGRPSSFAALLRRPGPGTAGGWGRARGASRHQPGTGRQHRMGHPGALHAHTGRRPFPRRPLQRHLSTPGGCAPPTTTPAEPAPEPAGQDRPTQPATTPAGENRRGLEILLRKVRQYWIDGVWTNRSSRRSHRPGPAACRMRCESLGGDSLDRPVGASRRESQQLSVQQKIAAFSRKRAVHCLFGRARLRQDHLHAAITQELVCPR